MKPQFHDAGRLCKFNRGATLIASLVCLVGAAASGAVTSSGDANLHAGSAAPAGGGDEHDSLAKKLANPLAAMISVPFQNNFDFGAGPAGDGYQWKMNVQPVIPICLTQDWNLITRFILPVINQNDVAGTYLNPSGTQTGFGDTVASFWFSPSKPTASGLIWGIGPAFNLPTGSNIPLLGSNQWAAGPTAVGLWQKGKWTYGGLVNHLWSYAGTGGLPGINNTYMQPFLNYIPGGGWTVAFNSESSYNWQASQWTIPFNLSVKKMFKMGPIPAQWEVGGRYYVEKPDQGPDWGFRLTLTMLFPKG